MDKISCHKWTLSFVLGSMTAIRFLLFVLPLLAPASVLAADPLSYESFLKAALEQNLGLKIESAKSGSTRSNSKALNIPPPVVGYMRMTDQSGSSANGIEVTQTIPFPGKLSHDHSARKYEEQAQDETRKAAESEIRAKAKVIYFNLWASEERRAAFRQKRSAIQDHIRLSRAGVRSDSFLRIHLLKAESDLDLLENDLIAADQDVIEKEAQAAEFLNVDATTFHPALEEPPATQLPREKSLASSHQLEAARLTLESFKARESAANSTWFPDLYLRYKEIGQTQLMPQTSEVMIGVSLPFIFPWDASASAGKASAQRSQSEFEFEQETRKIDTEQGVLIQKATSLRKQLDNITQKLLPRAEKRMKLVHNLAPRDMETLQDHRETMEAFPDLKLKALDLRAQYEDAVAKLLKYDRGTP
jgi:cobalt-zinc-cadmium efflux system outer membrane protein